MSSNSSPIHKVCLVQFHHQRGPETEWVYPSSSDDSKDESPLLPFMALPDGSHTSEYDFSYFTLFTTETVFGLSCNMQLKTELLEDKPKDVTRSTIQKAVVVLSNGPYFGAIREKLLVVTKAFFNQHSFEDKTILINFYDSLVKQFEEESAEELLYTFLPLSDILTSLQSKTLQVLKAILLQSKVLIYASKNTEMLCSFQFSILSLIPGMLETLGDCADPSLSKLVDSESRKKATEVKTSDRKSLMTYLGLPLLLFSKNAFFNPYAPLQQLDLIEGSTSFLIGSTNSLFLQQKNKFDVIVNLDDYSLEIVNAVLTSALALSSADRAWIDEVTNSASDTTTVGGNIKFIGGDEWIRGQFEEYLFALLSTVRYFNAQNPPQVDTNPVRDYNQRFIQHFIETEAYKAWDAVTDSNIYDITEPRHPGAKDDSLGLEDLQNRIHSTFTDLKLDERSIAAREAISKSWVASSKKISESLTGFWDKVDDYQEKRQAERAKRDKENKKLEEQEDEDDDESKDDDEKSKTSQEGKNSDIGVKVVSTVENRLNSWAKWASEKRQKLTEKNLSKKQSENSQPKSDEITDVEAKTVEENISDKSNHQRSLSPIIISPFPESDKSTEADQSKDNSKQGDGMQSVEL